MEEVLNNTAKRRVAPLTIVLGCVFVFFCFVLVFVYAETKRINPVMLDEHGHPIGQSAQPPAGGAKH
jgi:hypothetical protein